ncbi:MAG: hypothetical protein WAT34_08870 [Chitinophagaceae bacterium]|nr:hypothetical protein [Chitinophagaceae bacterium]MBK9568470.1 hypothetical protein [Chitinophagaceae bacterium]
MRFLLPPGLLACLLIFVSFLPAKEVSTDSVSPLAGYSPDWNDTRYLSCNTAAKANYMTAAEKEVIYILNLARMNPVLFAKTVVNKYPVNHSDYYTSLQNTLLKLKPVKLLYPDSLSFAGALCHAINSGAEGYVGHKRSTEACNQKWYYNGECCDYGHHKPLDIIMSLLIDEDVPSLGHRDICLGQYKKIGVSIQYHKTFQYNAVLDFHY